MSFMPRLSNLFFLPPRILPVFVCLFLLSAAIGLSRPAEAESELPFGHGLLWQLEKEGAPTSYVFGTIHIADQRVLNLPDVVLDALNRSERVIFELVFDASVRTTMAQSMVLTDGRTLAQILGPDLFEQSKAVAQSYGLPPQSLQLLKPWALIPIFSFPPEQFALVAGGQAPLDEWLQIEVVRAGKRVVGLETLAEQLALFEGASEEEQVAMLRAVVEDRDSVARQFQGMLTSYLKRDLASIYSEMLRQTENELQDVEDFEVKFVIDRNHRMVERALPHLSSAPSFIAVGALHLPGSEGIIALLQAEGYKVTRLY